MKAVWNGAILAESDKQQLRRIESNWYFPPESVKQEYFTPSETHTTCPWKGEASYYTIVVDRQSNEDAAWYYPQPKEGATERVGDFTNYVAFWRGVEVQE